MIQREPANGNATFLLFFSKEFKYCTDDARRITRKPGKKETIFLPPAAANCEAIVSAGK